MPLDNVQIRRVAVIAERHFGASAPTIPDVNRDGRLTQVDYMDALSFVSTPKDLLAATRKVEKADKAKHVSWARALMRRASKPMAIVGALAILLGMFVGGVAAGFLLALGGASVAIGAAVQFSESERRKRAPKLDISAAEAMRKAWDQVADNAMIKRGSVPELAAWAKAGEMFGALRMIADRRGDAFADEVGAALRDDIHEALRAHVYTPALQRCAEAGDVKSTGAMLAAFDALARHDWAAVRDRVERLPIATRTQVKSDFANSHDRDAFLASIDLERCLLEVTKASVHTPADLHRMLARVREVGGEAAVIAAERRFAHDIGIRVLGDFDEGPVVEIEHIRTREQWKALYLEQSKVFLEKRDAFVAVMSDQQAKEELYRTMQIIYGPLNAGAWARMRLTKLIAWRVKRAMLAKSEEKIENTRGLSWFQKRSVREHEKQRIEAAIEARVREISVPSE